MSTIGNHRRTTPTTTAGRLSPRAIRVRNRCLAMLAKTRSMPAPSAGELSRLGNQVGLADAWAWWSSQQSGPVRIAVSQPVIALQPAWWRSRWVALTILAVSALASTLVVFAQLRPSTNVNVAPADVSVPAPPLWSPVSETTLARVNGLLVQLGQSSAPMAVQLSPSDLASLVFRSSLRRRPPGVTDADARIDSLLWIRGTVGRPSGAPVRIEIGGDVRVTRPGAAVLVIKSMRATDVATGRDVPPSNMSTIRFSLPSFASDIRIAGGQAVLTTGQLVRP
jgi:hypothetical protein